MGKGRLEAFSDGVFAIIITIMVLELRPPHGADWSSLQTLIPNLISYILSFVFLGIYWTNHHHLLQAVQRVNGTILWANLHLLFWMSLVPFATAWIGQDSFAALPLAVYGMILFSAAVAYTLLVRALIFHHGKNSTLSKAMGKDFKGKISLLLYALAILSTWYLPRLAYALYILVAVIWLIPDKRIEKRLVV